MHRFRKKSDAKRAQVPDHLLLGNSSSQQPTLLNQSTNTPDTLPALPPASDFRTSLILPSLSKRFTLLRTSNGDPISLKEVRSKFAEQRARGAEFQVSEEEEDMIVEALGEIQAASAAGSQPYDSPTPSDTTAAFSPGADSMFAGQQDMPHHLSAGGDLDSSASIRSGFAPSIASTPSSVYPRSIPSSTTSRTANFPRYTSRRHSNNLFGSGRFHDTSYIHSVNKASVGSRSTTSLAGSDSQGGSVRSAHSVREVESHTSPTTMSHADTSAGTTTAPDKTSPVKAWPNTPLSALPSRMSKEFSIQQVRRTSLALEEVIRGIEEEAEETIMVPRTSAPRFIATNSTPQSPKNVETTSAASTPIPWMTDEARVDDRDEDDPAPSTTAHPSSPSPSPVTYSRPGTTSPTPRLPGYIPGMTRPLTPRDVDSDDGATGYSTTPRARSPAQPQHSHPTNHNHPLSFSASRHHHQASLPSEGQSILPPSILRRGSTQVPPLRTTSPGLGSRSRGSAASSPLAPSPVPSPGLDDRNKSDILTRRSLSPFTGPVASGYGGSRPGTPSGVVSWSPLPHMHMIQSTSAPENDSGRPQTEAQGTSANYVTESPTQKDTMHESHSTDFPAFGGWLHSRNSTQNVSNGTVNPNGLVGVHREPSVSSIDLGQSLNSRPSATAAKIAARAPTPVHTHSRSPTFNESGNGHDSILLNRSVSKRAQRRMTPPPHIQPLTHTSLMLHTPSSSSNSSSNVNLNHHPTSPLFSPILNTSASSLLSAGSSYHSWENETTKKSGWDQLMEHDSQRSVWREILHSGVVGANETDDASETEAMGSPEHVLRTLTGLTKGDLAALQKKLVADALPRKGFDPPRSPTRRRRISASRTSLSVAQAGRESGTNSPAPPPRQATPVTEQSLTTPSPESRRTALLASVLNSIQPPSATPTPVSTPASSDTPSVDPPSSTDDASSNKFTSVSSNGDSRDEAASALKYKALAEAIEGNEPVSNDSSDQVKSDPPLSEPPQSQEEDSGEGTEVPLYQSRRSPSAPLPSGNAVQLVRDVSRKAAEATAALKNSSQAKIGEVDGTIKRRPTTKRIDLQQISSPQLVSSSTSVNAIPITQQHASPQTSLAAADPRSSLKLSQRFKKLRGTLRTKPASRDGEEGAAVVLPSPTDSPPSLRKLHSPVGPSQTVVYTQQHHVPPASATENGRFKVPVPSPPASAGPGLKGFMARFRKPKKDKEVGSLARDHLGHQSLDSTSSIPPTRDRSRQGFVYSPPSTAASRPSEDYTASRARSPTPDPATVNRLFDAASQLGLDRRAIDELLARSTSTSSRNTTRNQTSTAAFADILPNSVDSKPATPRAREDTSLDQTRTPDQTYKHTARPDVLTSRYPEGEILRRTIIFASDNPSTADLNGSNWKDSTSGRPQRSPSATSFYSTASGSATRGPPVPRLPAGLGRTNPAKPSDSGSFYDVYSQEQSFSNIPNGSAERPSSVTPENPLMEENEQGPALEVLHLSNGQVVWSVLDSLRAADNDDTGSLFRRSMASSRGNDVSEDMEVRFKEHRRWDSKGSNFSQGSHNSRRRQTVPSGPRPETKLYRTDSSTIGRLIEDLSRNMDSGSFNIMRPATATSATSFHSDTSGPSGQVERELEALLNAVNPRPVP